MIGRVGNDCARTEDIVMASTLNAANKAGHARARIMNLPRFWNRGAMLAPLPPASALPEGAANRIVAMRPKGRTVSLREEHGGLHAAAWRRPQRKHRCWWSTSPWRRTSNNVTPQR